MKRDTGRHPKMFELAQRLGINQAWAVGIVHELLEFAGKRAKRGDVGRWSNGAIADACLWSGDPDALVEALVHAGWIDRCAVHRLVIHDWRDHCEDSVKKALKAKGETFAVAVEIQGEANVVSSCSGANVAPLPTSVAELPEVEGTAESVRKIPENSRLPLPLPKPITPTSPRPPNRTASVERAGPSAAESVCGVVMEFWKRMPESSRGSSAAIAAAAGKPLASDCARAAELAGRWSVDDLREVVPKVVQVVHRKFPEIKAFGGAVGYFEAELGKLVQARQRKQRRDEEADKRRRESESAEAARSRRQALWRNLPEAERQRWRDMVKGELPLFYDQRPDQKADLVEVMAIAKYEEASK